MKLLTSGSNNPKSSKSDKADNDWWTMFLHLSPANESGYQVCSSSSAGCRFACLNRSGHGKFDKVQIARKNRTLMWFENRPAFKAQLTKELAAFVKRCDKHGMRAAFRPNATSDILWEEQFPEMFDRFPSLQVYDYTKHVKRCLIGYSLPDNYHLTFSRSEVNDSDVFDVLDQGKCNATVVFDSKTYPEVWNDYPTYDADSHDLRFLDPPGGHVGALVYKRTYRDYNGGTFETKIAPQDTSGFIVNIS